MERSHTWLGHDDPSYFGFTGFQDRGVGAAESASVAQTPSEKSSETGEGKETPQAGDVPSCSSASSSRDPSEGSVSTEAPDNFSEVCLFSPLPRSPCLPL